LTTKTGYLKRNNSRITIINIRDPIKEIQEGCKNAWPKELELLRYNYYECAKIHGRKMVMKRIA